MHLATWSEWSCVRFARK